MDSSMAMKIAFRKGAETLADSAKSLPQKYFVSPDIFAQEQARIFFGQSQRRVDRARRLQFRKERVDRATGLQLGRMVCSTRWKIFALEHVDLATGEADRLRRARELEADVRKLFGVLPLPRRASTAAESFTLRFGGERSAGRAVPRRIHEDQSGQEPDHERKRVCGVCRQDRESSAGFLLFDLPEHAAQSAPGIRDGASTVAAVARANVDRVRLVFSSGRGPSRAGSIQSG